MWRLWHTARVICQGQDRLALQQGSGRDLACARHPEPKVQRASVVAAPKIIAGVVDSKIGSARVAHTKVVVALIVAPNIALAVFAALGGANRHTLDGYQPAARGPPARCPISQIDGIRSLFKHIQGRPAIAASLGVPHQSGGGGV